MGNGLVFLKWREDFLFLPKMGQRLSTQGELPEKCDPDRRDIPNLRRCLMDSARYGDIFTVSHYLSLLEEAGYKEGLQEALYEAGYGGSRSVLSYLLVFTDKAFPALLGAIKGDHDLLVDFILSQDGVSLTPYDISKAIQYAAEANQLSPNMVRFLRNKRVIRKQELFNRGLYGAAAGGHRDLVDFFLRQGADNLYFAFVMAAENGHLSLLRYLYSRGARYIDIALWAASRKGHRDIVAELLRLGAKPRFGLQPAVETSNLPLVQLLLEADRDLRSITSRDCRRALDIARSRGNLELEHLLSQKCP